MSSQLEQFLTPYSPIVHALALKLRALIREVMPDTIKQLDAPAYLIGYGFDRTYAEEETHLLLIKPSETPHTGDAATAAPRRTI